MTYSQGSSVKGESLSLGVHDIAVLHVLGLGHEGSLMQVGVELLRLALGGLFRGVESLHTVLLEGVHENILGHLQTSDQFHQFLIALRRGTTELIGWHREKGPVKVVNAFEKVNGEFLNSKVTGDFHVTLSALLEVKEVRDGTNIFVLLIGKN